MREFRRTLPKLALYVGVVISTALLLGVGVEWFYGSSEGAETDPPVGAKIRFALELASLTPQEEVPMGMGGGSLEEDEPEPEIIRDVRVHRVSSGETLGAIARRYGLQVNTLLDANPIADPSRISIGQELRIPPVDGVIHVVRSGESLWTISRDYGVSVAAISDFNKIASSGTIRPKQQLIIPGARLTEEQRYLRLLEARGGIPYFAAPLQGRISSPFGPRWGSMHYGVDYAVVIGTQVRASAPGRVTQAAYVGSYGNLIIIDHGNNIETRYAHLNDFNVRIGQTVSQGQVIARSGNTGRSTGPHLHFEIRINGQAVDPLKWIGR